MIVGMVKEIWRYPVKSMSGEQLDDFTLGPLGIPGDRGWALRDETTKEVTSGKRIPLLMQCAARYCEEPADTEIPQVEITLPDATIVRSDDPTVNEQLSSAFGRSLSLWARQPASNKAHYRRASVVSRLSRFKVVRDQLPRLMRLGHVDAQVREMFSREPHEALPDLGQLPPELLEFTSPPGTYFDAFPVQLLTSASLAAMTAFNPTATWDVRRFRPNLFIEAAAGIDGLVEAGWSGRTLRLGSAVLKAEIPTFRCGMTMHAQSGLPKDPSILRSIVRDADQNLGTYASVVASGKLSVGDALEVL